MIQDKAHHHDTVMGNKDPKWEIPGKEPSDARACSQPAVCPREHRRHHQ